MLPKWLMMAQVINTCAFHSPSTSVLEAQAAVDQTLGPFTTGVYEIIWKSRTASLDAAAGTTGARIAMLGTTGTGVLDRAFDLEYIAGGDLSTPCSMEVNHTVLPGTWNANEYQTFRAVVDLNSRTFDFFVDGEPVVSDAGFRSPGFSDLDFLLFNLGTASDTEIHIDNLSISKKLGAATTVFHDDFEADPAQCGAGRFASRPARRGFARCCWTAGTFVPPRVLTTAGSRCLGLENQWPESRAVVQGLRRRCSLSCRQRS